MTRPLGADAQAATDLVEDVDNNCVVDVRDVEYTAGAWHQVVTAQTDHLDVNDDLRIDVVDVGDVSSNIGRTCDVPAWLAHLNTYRDLANLPPLAENPEWSQGMWLHSRYSVKNDILQHSEDPNNPWYTPEGDAAAQSSVLLAWAPNITDEQAIDAWMETAYHGLDILAPELALTGFGSYREEIGTLQMAAGLDVWRGRGEIPPDVGFPIMFPADGKTMPIMGYWGGEVPDPLEHCPGYTIPTGPAITLQLDEAPDVTAYSFYRNTVRLEACAFASPYHSSAVVLMPRQPLIDGSYSVSITTSGRQITWSFTAGSASRTPEIPAGDVIIRLPYLARDYHLAP